LVPVLHSGKPQKGLPLPQVGQSFSYSKALFLKQNFFFWSYLYEPFGAWYQVEVVQNLLDNGFAVIAPNAGFGGSTFWDTNVPPFDFDWSIAPDHYLMLKLFDMIEQGKFGKLDINNLYATGISSGGYMTSRMAISYRKMFKALVIQSASYCICSGPLCVVPELPSDHPPTLFLHGRLDPVVPIFTMWKYHDKMVASNLTTKVIVNDYDFHEWIKEAPENVYKWFMTYS